MPPQITYPSALPGKTRKHENHIFHSIGLCYTHNAPVRYLPERKKSHLWCVSQRLTFLEIERYPLNTVHWLFYSTLDEEQLSSFTQRLTAWHTRPTQSTWVTHSRMLCSLPRSCLVHPVDRFDSEGWFSSDQVIFLAVLCFWRKSIQYLSEKMQFLGFLFPQVVQKH